MLTKATVSLTQVLATFRSNSAHVSRNGEEFNGYVFTNIHTFLALWPISRDGIPSYRNVRRERIMFGFEGQPLGIGVWQDLPVYIIE